MKKDNTNIIKQKYDIIILILAVLISLVLRWCCRNYESEDFLNFLSKWVEFYRENGGFHALKTFDGDYNVLYQYVLIIISYFDVNSLYAIKFVSCAFDFLLAYGCLKCLDVLGADKKKQHICFAVMVLLPTILLNSSCWAQCDSIYASFIIWSIYYLIRKKNIKSIILITLAFSLKLQTIFIMPVYLISFVKKNIRFRELFVFPIVYLMVYVPAMCFGKPLTDIIGVYLTQTTEYPLMVMNAPTIFSLFGIYSYNAVIEKIFIAVAGIYVLFVVAIGVKSDKISMIKSALLLAAGIPFLLPHMHERYFYVSLIFAVLCTFLYGKKYFWVAICIELSSLMCYMHYFEFVNRYCNKILSVLCSTYVSVLLMVIAVCLSLLLIFAKNKYCKRILIPATVIISALILINTHNFVWINDKMVNFSATDPYFDEQENLMIPLRNFANAIGGNLYYDAESGKIAVEYEDSKILLASGSNVVQVDDKEIPVDGIVAANGYTYISHSDTTKVFDMACIRRRGNEFLFYKN